MVILRTASFIDMKMFSFLYFVDRNFIIANAKVDNNPIIFCNDGFCNLSGYSRAEVMQKSCVCEFMQGPQTSRQMVVKLRESLSGKTERLIQLLLYRKNGNVYTKDDHFFITSSQSCLKCVQSGFTVVSLDFQPLWLQDVCVNKWFLQATVLAAGDQTISIFKIGDETVTQRKTKMTELTIFILGLFSKESHDNAYGKSIA